MEQKYFDDADENLRFIRCAEYMYKMIQKYSDAYITEESSDSKTAV